jgi:predicted amidophosphoribosyltransferase
MITVKFVVITVILLLLLDKKRLQLCPECDAELHPNQKFCQECGKNVREIFSNVHKKQGNDV